MMIERDAGMPHLQYTTCDLSASFECADLSALFRGQSADKSAHSKEASGVWYILAMEVARQFKESPSYNNGVWITKKFTISAAVVILAATIFGGTMGSGRNFSTFSSTTTKNSYRVADEIEKDYNEAVSTITSNYSGEIDHEK